MLWTGGDLDGERVAGPHVGGAAPAAGVRLVDELEIDAPRVETIVGHDEAQPSDEHRLAAGSVGQSAEDLGDRAESVGLDGAGRLDPVVLPGEGAEHEADDGGRRRPIPRHDRLPTGALQAGAGGVVDEVARRSSE